jgi:hypothetical protein
MAKMEPLDLLKGRGDWGKAIGGEGGGGGGGSGSGTERTGEAGRVATVEAEPGGDASAGVTTSGGNGPLFECSKLQHTNFSFSTGDD